MSAGDTYYVAGGQEVPLRASSDVVIDLYSEAARDLSDDELESLRAKGRSLSPSLLLVPESSAAEVIGTSESSGPGIHPVFHADDGSLIVVLPEVRVEARDDADLDEIGRAVTNAHVKEQTKDRLVLEPDSGRGEDALELANTLAKSPLTDVSQARFMRVVPRPEPSRDEPEERT